MNSSNKRRLVHSTVVLLILLLGSVANAQSVTYGNVDPYDTTALHPADQIIGIQVAIPVEIRLESFGMIYGDGQSIPPPEVNSYFGLYTSDQNGEPENLIVTTNSILLNAQQTYDSNVFTTSRTIQPGTYWMVGLYDTPAEPRVSFGDPNVSARSITSPYSAGLPNQIVGAEEFTGLDFNYWINGTIATPGIVSPTGFAVVDGNYVVGGVSELSSSDNMDLSARRSPVDVQSRVTATFNAISPLANPGSLSFTVESSVFARTAVNQHIELFDFGAQEWELIDFRTSSAFQDLVVESSAAGDVSRFVEPNTLAMEARIRFVSPAQRQAFAAHIDHVFWTFGPGEIRLVSSVYTISEAGEFVEVQVIREAGAAGRVSIEYDTVDSTAIAGEDYEARSGTIVWEDLQAGIQTISIPILEDSQFEGDHQFSFTIDNPVGDAKLTAPRTATITIDDNDLVKSVGDGLLGEYYDNIDFTSRFTFQTDETVDFNWGSGAPLPGMGENSFSVRWTGEIEARYNENYTFQTWSDDGIRVWINDILVINEWDDHGPTFHTGEIELEAGVLNDIRIEYYENGGGAVAQLAWSSNSQALEVVPTSQLYRADDPPVGNELTTQIVLSGLNSPTCLEWSPDGTNMYVGLRSGLVNVVHNDVLESTPFIDIRDIVNSVRDRGMLGMAVHPDFQNNPYVYLLFTYDPPETANFSGLAGRDGMGNRAGRMIRVTADASNDYKTAIPGSEIVLLGTNSTWDNFNGFANSTDDFNEPPAGINGDGTNIRDFVATDSESHTVGALVFGTDGNLFVSIGDGASYNAMDPRGVRVQDIDNLSGKVLRINPITGQGVSDNPFYNGDADANRSRVYQLGLRNPFRMSVDPVSGQLYIGDVGWAQWEEVNASGPGANFGWPYYEGGSGVNLQTNEYQNLPEAQAFYASGDIATPGILALNHNDTGINAIVLGDVYTGTTYPKEYHGDLFFNDLGQGIVRNISFDSNGDVTQVQTFATGAQIVVSIRQGPDGNMYYIDLNDGRIGRWVFQ